MVETDVKEVYLMKFLLILYWCNYIDDATTPPPSTTVCVEVRVGTGFFINDEYTYQRICDFYSSCRVTGQNCTCPGVFLDIVGLF